jgi:tripartite-type tricarboxylate transporter receptor subunit TctC
VKKFKGKIVFLLIIILTMFLVAGCNSEKDSSGDTSNYPNQSIKIIVPSSAGGGTDSTTRSLAAQAEKKLGQSIGILNKPGASGSVGMTEGANAKPDGYTLTMVFVELTMYKHLGLSPLTPDEFKPVAMINFDPAALTVRSDAPYNTLEEFIDYAREHPGEISVGNAGTGSIWHIAAVNLAQSANIKLNHVPYDGAAPAVTALVGGHIDAVTVSPAEVKAQLDAGNLKTLAVMAEQRSALIPEVPTFKESGIKAESIGTWRGIVVPKATPDKKVAILEEAFLAAAKEKEFQDFMKNNGLGIQLKNSQEFKKFITKNEEFFGEMIAELGLGQ